MTRGEIQSSFQILRAKRRKIPLSGSLSDLVLNSWQFTFRTVRFAISLHRYFVALEIWSMGESVGRKYATTLSKTVQMYHRTFFFRRKRRSFSCQRSKKRLSLQISATAFDACGKVCAYSLFCKSLAANCSKNEC